MYFISGLPPQGASAPAAPLPCVTPATQQQLRASHAPTALTPMLPYPHGAASVPMTALTQPPYYQLFVAEPQAQTHEPQPQFVSPTGVLMGTALPPYTRTSAGASTLYAVPVASLPSGTASSTIVSPMSAAPSMLPTFMSVAAPSVYSSTNTTVTSASFSGRANVPPGYTDLPSASMRSVSLMPSNEVSVMNMQYGIAPLAAAVVAADSPYARPRPAAGDLPVRNVGLRGYEAGVYYEGRVKRYNASRGYGFLCASHKFVPAPTATGSPGTAASTRGKSGQEALTIINGIAHTRQRVTVNDIFVHQRSLIASAPTTEGSPDAAATAAFGAAGGMSVLVDLRAGSLVRFRAELFMPANVASYVDSDREAVLSSIGLGGSKDASVLKGAILTEKGWGFQAVEVQLLPPRGTLAPDNDDDDLPDPLRRLPGSPPTASSGDVNASFVAPNEVDAAEEERRRLGRAGLVRHDPSVRVHIALNPPSLNGTAAHPPPPPPPPLPAYGATPLYGS